MIGNIRNTMKNIVGIMVNDVSFVATINEISGR
jgi:hypothetical protein